MLKKYTPFEPAKIGSDPLSGMRKRVVGSATASGFNPKDQTNLDILSTNVSLSSTGQHNFNYSNTGVPNKSGNLPTILEAQNIGKSNRLKGLPLEIPAIDHKKAARKLQRIGGGEPLNKNIKIG